MPDAYFPFEYVCGFLRLLRAWPLVRVVTYADLPWGDDYNPDGYPDELRRWQQSADPNAITVVLQHDVDDAPRRTWALIEEERRMGLRANVLIFNRCIDAMHLTEVGEVRTAPYPTNDPLLLGAQNEGFVIGYHQNAYEQAGHDAGKAARIFEDDVAALRERGFAAKFFVPHGGAPGPDGTNNHSLTIPPSLARDIRWVYNRRGPRFHGSYSDGAINVAHTRLRRIDPAKRDLRDFVRTWRPGRRYRVLLHPQYYDTPFEVAANLAGTAWYPALLDAHERGESGWEQVLC